jgi:GAF domain-containing protein
MFNKSNYRQKDTTFDATGPLPGAEAQFKERTTATVQMVRQSILQTSLYGSVAFGVIALLATLPNRLANKQYLLIFLFSAAVLAATIIAFARGVKYQAKVITFLVLLAVLSISTMLSDGLYGNGRLFLLTIPIMTVQLVDSRKGIIALVSSIAFFGLVGGLMLLGIIPPPSIVNANSSISLWVVAFATVVLVATTTTLSLNSMLGGLQRSIETEQRLRTELDGERSALEGRIHDRTSDLQRRLVQLRTAGEITNALGAMLDPQTLLQQVVDLVQQRFDLYYVGVFLLDERSENAILRAGSGESGQVMLAQGHYLPLDGKSMIAWSINNRQARIALDVGSEAVRFSNPNLPLTRSELALPLLRAGGGGAIAGGYGLAASSEEGVPVGALTIQSNRPQAFDEDDIIILQSIATALSTALANANLFQQVESNLKEIRTLNRQYLQESWDRTIDQAIQDRQELRASAVDSILLAAWEQARQQAENAQAEPAEAPPAERFSVSVPLVVREHHLGAIRLDAVASEPGQSGLHEEDLAFVEVIAQETAQALENIRLLEETQGRARREQAINAFMGNLSSSLDLDTLLRSAARQLGLLPNVREAAIRLRVSEAPTVNDGKAAGSNGAGTTPTAEVQQ